MGFCFISFASTVKPPLSGLCVNWFLTWILIWTRHLGNLIMERVRSNFHNLWIFQLRILIVILLHLLACALFKEPNFIWHCTKKYDLQDRLLIEMQCNALRLWLWFALQTITIKCVEIHVTYATVPFSSFYYFNMAHGRIMRRVWLFILSIFFQWGLDSSTSESVTIEIFPAPFSTQRCIKTLYNVLLVLKSRGGGTTGAPNASHEHNIDWPQKVLLLQCCAAHFDCLSGVSNS